MYYDLLLYIYMYIYIYIYTQQNDLMQGRLVPWCCGWPRRCRSGSSRPGRSEGGSFMCIYIYIYMYICICIYAYYASDNFRIDSLSWGGACRGLEVAEMQSIRRGDDVVGNPHRAQISQSELFELTLVSKVSKQFPVERFEATVSQSTVPSPPQARHSLMVTDDGRTYSFGDNNKAILFVV